MKMRFVLLSVVLSLGVFACGQTVDSPASNRQDLSALNAQHEPPMLGIHWARGFTPFARVQGARNNPDMTYHGGVIMPSTVSEAIYWGPSWAHSTFVGIKLPASIPGTQVSVTPITPKLQMNTLAPMVRWDQQSLTTVIASTYPPLPMEARLPRLWRRYVKRSPTRCVTDGSCSGVTVQVAFFFNLDGDAGCDPQDTSGLHSQGLAALANVSGHELSEARTDPDNPGAWYDKRGQENGDKCAWTFHVPLVTFSNSTQWKIQGEWSNHAYNTGAGYPNSPSQKGCLDGH